MRERRALWNRPAARPASSPVAARSGAKTEMVAARVVNATLKCVADVDVESGGGGLRCASPSRDSRSPRPSLQLQRLSTPTDNDYILLALLGLEQRKHTTTSTF